MVRVAESGVRPAGQANKVQPADKFQPPCLVDLYVVDRSPNRLDIKLVKGAELKAFVNNREAVLVIPAANQRIVDAATRTGEILLMPHEAKR